MKAIETPAAFESGGFERRGLSDEQLRSLLRNMLMQRTLDNRGFQLNRQGKIPFALGSEGHEALQAGAAMAFRRNCDVLVPYYRDAGLVLGVGMTAYDLLLSMFARAADRSGGRQFPNHFTASEKGVMSISSIIAAHCTHAAGVAYAIKYNSNRTEATEPPIRSTDAQEAAAAGTAVAADAGGLGGDRGARRPDGNQQQRAVLCTFGDGATSQGEWHEAINFSAVHRLPIVFLCENNRWAISVPQSKQMAVHDIIDKAAGYGLPGIKVDGVDAIATYAAVKEALDRARSGGGPTLVEATCFRFLSHSTDDDDRSYRSRDDVEASRINDPVPNFQRVLVGAGVVSEADVAALKADVLREINEATDRAEAMPSPQPSDLYSNVYEGTYEPWL